MQLIKVSKKTNSKIEQARTYLSLYCLLSEIRLSQTELTVLAYFLVYRINDQTKDLIIKSQILNADSLKNTMSKLSKYGLIKKHPLNKEYYVNEKIAFSPDTKVAMLIQIDNS